MANRARSPRTSFLGGGGGKEVTFGPGETRSTDDLSATIEDPKEDGMRNFLSNSNNTLFYIS